MTTTISDKCPPFVGGFEGKVLTVYKDAGGLDTVGHGSTWHSKTLRDWWAKNKPGTPFKVGEKITSEDATHLLGLSLKEEYAPPVAKAMPPSIPQYAFDAATSGVYNFGPGGLKWKWAKALADGLIRSAAELLRTTATTSGGKKLRGLVRRREAEAHLMETGDYGDTTADHATSIDGDDVKDYQTKLKTLGYYKGDIDGIAGELTLGAVKNFQRDNKLEVDGKVGPATRAALRRAIDKKHQNQSTAGGAAAGGAVGSGGEVVTTTPDSAPVDAIWSAGTWAIIIALLVLAAWMAWRYRGVILRKRTPA